MEHFCKLDENFCKTPGNFCKLADNLRKIPGNNQKLDTYFWKRYKYYMELMKELITPEIFCVINKNIEILFKYADGNSPGKAIDIIFFIERFELESGRYG